MQPKLHAGLAHHIERDELGGFGIERSDPRVQLRLHTFVADAIVEDGAVTGVIAASKSGLEALKAQITVDCSRRRERQHRRRQSSRR